MAVFWFGWGKKLKNALTRKQADGLYLPKSFEDTLNSLNTRITTLESRTFIKWGNEVFKTERKNIQGGNVSTKYSPATGFSITNLVSGKLYFVEVYYKTGTYDRALIFYYGTILVSMYLPQIGTTILFGNYRNQSLEVFADKAVNNLSISFKEVIITN